MIIYFVHKIIDCGLFTQGEPVLNSEKYTVPILVFYGKSIKLLGAGQ